MTRAAIFLLCAVAGCVAPHAKTRKAAPPAGEVRTVAVLPFLSRVDVPVDGDEYGNSLADEILRLDGFRVMRPVQVRAAMQSGETLRTAEDALRLGRRLGVDAVLACFVTEYDPYEPPKVVLAVQLMRVASGPLSGTDVDRIVQSASWRGLPAAQPGQAIAAFEEVYDARDARLRRKIAAYAEERGGDSAFPQEREFLAVQSRFMQFVSSLVVQRAFEKVPHGS